MTNHSRNKPSKEGHSFYSQPLIYQHFVLIKVIEKTPIQGKLALMFLKSYLGCSDKRLMERLTTDYALQFFCGAYFRADEKLPGYKVISDIRCELAGRLKVKDAQLVLAKAWAPYMKDTHVQLQDATCYETHMRYPTDVKLLWECCEWTHGQITRMCKVLECRMPRSRFCEQKNKYLAYQRNRKKTYKKRLKRTRSLLYLAKKLNGQLEELEQMLPVGVTMAGKYYERTEVIKQVLVQQIRSILSKERATRLEGSFGTEKNHYGLQRIAARTKKTEILWIFFGIHTANSVEIAKRMSAEQVPRQRAA